MSILKNIVLYCSVIAVRIFKKFCKEFNPNKHISNSIEFSVVITKNRYFLCVDSRSYKATADQNQCGMRIHADPDPNYCFEDVNISGIFFELSLDCHNYNMR